MKLQQPLMAVLCSALLFSSCKKDKIDTPPPPPPDLTPSIASISPTSAGYGAVVTISGSNFNTDKSKDTVTIGGLVIPVESATATTLTIKLPSLLATGSGTVEVKTSNGKITGPKLTYVPDIFIAGSEAPDANSEDVATLWKNDTAQTVFTSTNGASANAIVLNGSDIVIGGMKYTSMVNPTIWKNGVLTTLPVGAEGGNLNAVAVSGNDIYAVGALNTPNYSRATYWRNGTSYTVAPNALGSNASAIAVSGNDVYIAGYETDGNRMIPKYYRNGTAYTLANANDGNCYINAINLSGNDVYVAGSEVVNSKESVRLWRNGTIVPIPATSNHERVAAMTIVGNDVYLAGIEINSTTGAYYAKYWKNGVATNVTDGSTYVVLTGIAVFENDVYVTGFEQLNSTTKSVYWKNGVKTILTKSVSGHGYAQAIALR